MSKRLYARVALFAAIVIPLLLRSEGQAAENDWPTATPEEVGMDSEPLVAMFEFVEQRKIPIHSIQIVRHGRLALDSYFFPYSDQKLHDVASVTKSVTSTLVGLAIDKGFLEGTHQSILNYLPASRVTNAAAAKQKISIESLLTMQAGWDCGFEPHEQRLSEMRQTSDWAQFTLDLPMVAEPGERWAYCSGNCHVLSALVSRATQTNALAFARRELFLPLGIRKAAWPADAHGVNHGWGDLQLHPRDMAKIGELMLRRGRWKGQQVLADKWVDTATRAHVLRTGNQDHYGYYWWVKGKEFAGMFEAVGRGGQRITVWPAKDLVVVFTGGGFEPGDLAPFLLKALKSDKALPANPQSITRLKAKSESARIPAARTRPTKLPDRATRISGKSYKLATNRIGWTELRLTFVSSNAATAQITWNGRQFSFPIGLDDVGRFAENPLTGLPQCVTGEWLNAETFLMNLDLVGGINYYRSLLTFSSEGNKTTIAVSERTGLPDERFEGVAVN